MCSAEIIWQCQRINKHFGHSSISITNHEGWGSQTPNLQLKFLKTAGINVDLNFQNQISWKIIMFIS